MRKIEVAERRARLALRHRLAAGHRAGDVVEAARSMVCLHGTDPATAYLSAWARVDGMAGPDLERALYVDRRLVKHLAMRRTLFVFEHCWFEVILLGRPAKGPQFDGTEDADMMVDGIPLAQLLDEYDAQCEVSNEIVAARSLDDVGQHPDFGVAAATLRWMLLHMLRPFGGAVPEPALR